jgi:[acyl-carrier-protein] S-malonyltransferase
LASSTSVFLPAASDSASAWLFPGQGAQTVGMGKDVWQDSAAARAVYATADRVLEYALSELCFDGPEELLKETEHTQPAIFATSLACLAAAVERAQVISRPAFMAGHSLGEYSALVAAGALRLEDGLLLLQERARLMADAGRSNPGTLAAVVGLDEATVQMICDETDVDICNLNLPSQTVIGGTIAGVAAALELAKQRGAQRVLELNVSGAFHSRLMQPAVDGLRAAVGKFDVRSPEVPVIANASAQPLNNEEQVREELVLQVANSVRWHDSVTLMAGSGVSTFIEFGPGRVLTGFARRLVEGANLRNVSSLQPA